MAYKWCLTCLCSTILCLGISVNGIDLGASVNVGGVNIGVGKPAANIGAEKPVDAAAATHQGGGFFELKLEDFSAKFSNWGASIVSVVLPDKNGKLGDVVLGYDTVEKYKTDSTYFGALVGRVANRISGAQFSFEGKVYKVTNNAGNNTLHGGKIGFSDVAWKVMKQTTDSITFIYHSWDGEEGFPGDLDVSVTYTLEAPYTLRVQMHGETRDKATPVNLAQHTYWNMGGHDSGDVLEDDVNIFGSFYTPTAKGGLPTGEIMSVKNTPFDLLVPTPIGKNMGALAKLPIPLKGYDLNYVVDGNRGVIRPAARVFSSKSGRVMELSTDAPGVQFYTANWLKNEAGKNGAVYQAFGGLCLETQGYPDAVNHHNFPSQFVLPGKTYTHNMVYKFSLLK